MLHSNVNETKEILFPNLKDVSGGWTENHLGINEIRVHFFFFRQEVFLNHLKCK